MKCSVPDSLARGKVHNRSKPHGHLQSRERDLIGRSRNRKRLSVRSSHTREEVLRRAFEVMLQHADGPLWFALP